MSGSDFVRRAYDELAETYAAKRGDSPVRDRLEELLAEAPPDARLLDAGCGQGTPILERAAASTEAVGLDFSREQLRLAAENAPDGALVRGDMTALPFEADSFDVVVAAYSLIHVPLEQHAAVVEEFARVLRPGGTTLLSEGLTEWCGHNPDWLDTGVEMRWEIAGLETTRRQLRDAGFSVREVLTVEDALEDDDGEFPFFVARLEE